MATRHIPSRPAPLAGSLATPWGVADYVQPIGPDGILLVGTPSHGGFYVPDHLLHFIPRSRRERAKRWSGSVNWYEEDCEANSVIVAFPQHFEPKTVVAAVEALARHEKENK